MPDRDRFVLGKGHAAPTLYLMLAEKGFFPKEDLKTLRQLNSCLQGTPAPRRPGRGAFHRAAGISASPLPSAWRAFL
jgi:transketolase N-terminal domain/subunit